MAEQRYIVTVDGPAGVGKSTLSKRLAQALDIAYLDTGAMFRATAWRLGDKAWELDGDELAERMKDFSFSITGSGDGTLLLLDNEPVPGNIRSETVSMWASNLATRPEVREFQKQAQQGIGADISLVAEGRDMGTVVFPDARYKFYLDATPEIRAMRRHRQYEAMGRESDVKELVESIRARDEQDRNRAVAPLKPAGDAHIIDTSPLSKDQVFALMINIIKRDI